MTKLIASRQASLSVLMLGARRDQSHVVEDLVLTGLFDLRES